jgi:hypothetical protein
MTSFSGARVLCAQSSVSRALDALVDTAPDCTFAAGKSRSTATTSAQTPQERSPAPLQLSVGRRRS